MPPDHPRPTEHATIDTELRLERLAVLFLVGGLVVGLLIGLYVGARYA